MIWLKGSAIAIGISALMAAFFSYVMSKPENFMLWFAFMLACALGNSLTITPTSSYQSAQPEPTRKIFSGQTIHRPRLSRLKDPGIVVLAVVLAAALVWIFTR